MSHNNNKKTVAFVKAFANHVANFIPFPQQTHHMTIFQTRRSISLPQYL